MTRHQKMLSALISLFTLSQALILAPYASLPAKADGFPVIGTLHACRHPEALATDQQTHILYIACESPGQVVSFNPVAGKVLWRTPLGDAVTDLQEDARTHYVYAVYTIYHVRKASLVILNGTTGQVLLQQETGAGENSVASDSQRQQVFVAAEDEDTLYTFTLTSSKTQEKLTAHVTQAKLAIHPGGLGINSHLGRLYIADKNAHTISVLDEAHATVVATIPVAAVPLGPLRVDEQSGRVFVVCSTGQELDVIDGHTNTVIAHAPVVPYPEGIAISTATSRIYIAGEGDNEAASHEQENGTTITVLDSQTYTALGTLEVGRAPDGVEIDAGLRRVYVATEDSDAVVEISDSVNLPLKSVTTYRQDVARLAVVWLQRASILTFSVMLATLLVSLLAALLPRRRGQESPQTPPAGASTHPEPHSLQP